MPRPKKPGAPEPKKRSRNGCWPCKTRKIKCGEEKPKCQNCERQGETCDYSIRLNWEGRTKRKSNDFIQEPSFNITALSAPKAGVFTRTLSDSNLPSIKKINDSIDGSSDMNQKRKSASIGDAYSLAGASRNQYILDNEHRALSHLSPPETKVMGKLRLSKDNNMSTADDDTPMMPSTIDNGYNGTASVQRSGNFRDHISSAQLSRIRDQTTTSYPSPTDSRADSPPLSAPATYNYLGNHHFPSNSQMPPPLQSPSSSTVHQGFHRKAHEEVQRVGEPTLKKPRMSPSLEGPERNYSAPYTNFSGAAPGKPSSYNSPQAASLRSYSPSSTYGAVALTPAASSVTSEDTYVRSFVKPSSQTRQESPDRRLSVSSLLSGPPGGEEPFADSGGESTFPTSPNARSSTEFITYGIDRGFPDLDLPKNNDAIVLNGLTPSLNNANYGQLGTQDTADEQNFPEFGFGLHAVDSAHGPRGYYEKPVTVNISRLLGTLPAALRENPMNLLYFHHFLNHTASILVPHDCSENPFKNILPQMAVQDVNLLHLLLAYSASHRARLLKHPEPANRIALWVQDVFPNLRRALDDPNGQVSNANLAAAIMLASLEIISPNTFEVPVTWQNHLNVARRMLLARGGARSVHRKDRVSYFLSRWFAYLDVLGSLSGGKNDQPLFSGNYWATDEADEEEHAFQIDCLLGFTSRCVGILAKIAELARLCDSERIDTSGNIREDWQPSPTTIAAAEKLKFELQEARTHRYPGCPHRHAGADPAADGWDALEMVATNDAFHWAGQIHLHRRVLGKDSADAEVQTAVREIVGSLYKVRKGGTAEACLLFPMFTAGCDALDPTQREKIMERLKVVEGTGMTHVNKAIRLMEKSWETGRPWETLVSGEFFG